MHIVLQNKRLITENTEENDYLLLFFYIFFYKKIQWFHSYPHDNSNPWPEF